MHTSRYIIQKKIEISQINFRNKAVEVGKPWRCFSKMESTSLPFGWA